MSLIFIYLTNPKKSSTFAPNSSMNLFGYRESLKFFGKRLPFRLTAKIKLGMAENKTALVLVTRSEQSKEEVLVEKVKDLFEVNSVHALFIEEYYAMREEERIDLCETLLPITLCKVPESDGIGMWFFLSKEVLV